MGLIVKWTHQIVIVFYMAIVVHVLFVLWVGIVIPESLSKRRREEAHKLHLAQCGRKQCALSSWLWWHAPQQDYTAA